MLSITLIIRKLWWVFALKDKWKKLSSWPTICLCIVELYKAVSQDSLELISNQFCFKILDSAMTRTFGNRQHRITAVETLGYHRPGQNWHITKNVISWALSLVWESLQGYSFTISPQISNYSNSTRTALVPNFNFRNRLKWQMQYAARAKKTKGFKQWFWATNATHPMHWGALGALPQCLFNNWPFLLSRSTHAHHKYK